MASTKVDSEAFMALYRAEYPGAVRLAHALTANVETAEDVTQEAFLRVHERLFRLDNPGGYLRVVIVNLCRDGYRRQARQRLRLHLLPAPATEVSLQAEELLDVLSRLPYRYRTVLVLRYWCDWSEAEIAEALGCRPGAVKSLASRALARLRKELPS